MKQSKVSHTKLKNLKEVSTISNNRISVHELLSCCVKYTPKSRDKI